jgi:glycerol-3-phosphate dehydrogenase (NAD(P)+)
MGFAIAIVGAGMMGTAIAWPLADNGHVVPLVGTHLDGEIIQGCRAQRYHPTLKRQIPDGVQPYFVEDIAQALNSVHIIVSGVNSLGVLWIGRRIGPCLRPGQSIIAATKGLEARGITRQHDFPLMRTLVAIVVHGRPIEVPLDEFVHDASSSL